jgi:D-tyrosyl-tRNA(Tyr) deacylase
MRVVIQRVKKASVTIEEKVEGVIKQGFLVLVGIETADTKEDAEWLVNKIVNQRVFSDEEGKMNLSLKAINGELLIISQFTLHAQTKKGNRPSFIRAARPGQAIPLYEYFIATSNTALGENKIQTGIFGANMEVELINDGPVTITIDSKNKE